MTAVGKIFVFLVLIFSLLQGGLVIMLYTARTPWAAYASELLKQNQVSRANADQFKAEAEKKETEKVAAVAAKDKEITKLQEELKAKADQLADLRATEKKWDTEKTTIRETEKALQSDVKRRQDETEQLGMTLKTQLDKNKELVDQNNTLRQEKTTADIKANAFKVRNDEMVAKLEDMAREIARAKSPLAAGPGGKAGTGKNPPPENVEGLIRQSDPSGLVKITIGSDAGLVKGNTLEVFRLSTIADQSKYLGTIKIIDVSADRSGGTADGPHGRSGAGRRPCRQPHPRRELTGTRPNAFHVRVNGRAEEREVEQWPEREPKTPPRRDRKHALMPGSDYCCWP